MRTRSVVILVILFLLVIAIIVTVVVLVVRSRRKKNDIDFESFFFSDVNAESLNLISDALEEQSKTFTLDVRDGEFTRYVGIRPNDMRIGCNYKISPYYDKNTNLQNIVDDINKGTMTDEKLQSGLLKYWHQELTVEAAKAVVQRIPSIVGFIQEKKASPTIPSRTYFFTGDKVHTSEDRNGHTLWIKNDRLKNLKEIVVFKPPREVASNNWVKYDNLMIAGAVVHGPDTSMTVDDAKKWCAANYASHFEVRPGKGIVIKSIMLFPIEHASVSEDGKSLIYSGDSMFSEGLMEDTPEGPGTTYVRLDMVPHGQRLYYEGLLKRFEDMKKNSTCDSKCQFLNEWLPWLEIVTILLIPATAPLNVGLLTTILVEGAIIASTDVPLIVADKVLSNARDNNLLRTAFLQSRFKSVAPVENLDKVNNALEKRLGRSGLSLQVRLQLAQHNWSGTEMCKCRYGLRPCNEWEVDGSSAKEEIKQFESWPKAPYNYSSTHYNFIKFSIGALKEPHNSDGCHDIYRYLGAPGECETLPFREAISGAGLGAPKGISQYRQHYSDECEEALDDCTESGRC